MNTLLSIQIKACRTNKHKNLYFIETQVYLNVGVEMKRSVPFSQGGNRFPHLYQNLKLKMISQFK